ncbi:MAG: hypothetical protein NC133_03935 [Prevotella sp.]|nr:hypothetical protein [Prevotella sp.]
MKQLQIKPWLPCGLWSAVVICAISGWVSGFQDVGALVYDFCVLVPLLVIGMIHTVRCRREHPQSVLWTWCVLGVVWFMTIWLADLQSNDMEAALLPWCNFYQGKTMTESIRQITTVSNYTPFYNYFLILFAHWFNLSGCVYAIKYLTFLFSVALAVAMELIIGHLRQTKFNYGHLAWFLLLPPILFEFTAWGQCDAIYTTFCLFAFYWALKHRSVPCMINLGLAFAMKLQFLFICPIIFLLLIIRDADGQHYLQWRWVWLAPLMYVVNLFPACFGAPVWDLLTVYWQQYGEYTWISMNCANPGYLLNLLMVSQQQILLQTVVIIYALVGITATIGLFCRLLYLHRRQPLTASDLVRGALTFAFLMVYLMPKMHERFYFLAAVLAVVFALVQPNWHNTMLAFLVVTALTFPMFGYFCSYLYGWIVWGSALTLAGLILNTVVFIMLLRPWLRRI